VDVLSEILKAVKLEGAFYYNGEFTAPWGFRAPASCNLAPYFSLGANHVLIYHLLTEGTAVAGLDEGELMPLRAGDLVIFPHGDPHVLCSDSSAQPQDLGPEISAIVENGLNLARAGGGGALARFVCGYMTCDPQLSKALCAGLPPVFKVHIRDDAEGQWLENSIRHSVDGAGGSTPGGAAFRAKLSEVLFIEALRRYVAQLPPTQTGWLAGARDPEVGKALALMHRNPAHPWTIADLAREAGTSRSVFAERFREYLGEPPVAYLTRWRLQLGAQMLRSSSRSVAEIASEVGYESEAAFNRAFKREFDAPPARYRSAVRAQV